MSGVTQREVEVARLFSLGHSCKQIAALLGISFHTAKATLRHCYSKTGVTTQVEMVGWALRRGVITAEDLKRVMPTHGNGRGHGR